MVLRGISHVLRQCLESTTLSHLFLKSTPDSRRRIRRGSSLSSVKASTRPRGSALAEILHEIADSPSLIPVERSDQPSADIVEATSSQ